jgi:hypothetical protein
MDAEMDAAVVSESVGPDRERAPENGSRTSSPRSWWSLEWLSWLSRMRLSQWLNARLIAATLGVALLLVGPMTWVGISLANAGGNGQLPSAGPSTSAGFASMPGGHFPAGVPGGHIPAGVPGGGEFPSGSPGGGEFSPGDIPGFATALTGGTARVNHPLLAYLEAHRGSAKYLFATANTVAAAPYIIATGQSVMALGGFTGSDQILTVSQLKTLIREGQVNYFVFSDSIAASGSGGSGGPAGSEGAGSGFGNTELVQWVEAHGTKLTVGGTTMYYVSSAAVG